MVFQNDIIAGASGAGGGYTIDQSIRFNSADSAYLNRTPASASNRKTFTQSLWFKRGKISTNQFVGLTVSGSASYGLFLDSSNILNVYIYFTGSVWQGQLITSQVFRDPSAWYHFVLSVDTTQATSSDRIKIYVNGNQITAFSTANYPNQNQDTDFNSTSAHFIGQLASANYTDGYLTEINFIDGTALDATSFGETNNDGVWIPKAYTGSYGTNGFYITGADSADLGADDSGNGNDFTSSGLTSADQMLDTPTLNYCTLSPIDKYSGVTLSDGNLVATAGGGWYHGRGTLFAPSGKWYYEWIPTAGSYAEAGWMLNVSGNDYVEEESDVATTFYRGVGAAGRGFYIGSGSADTGPANFSLNDVIMMAIDVDTMKMWVGINGTWYNSGDPAGGTNPVGTWTAAIGESVAPWYGLFTSTSETFNFGQRPFAHTIPTGFNSWNTANLPTPSITDGSAHFQPTIYTGDGSSSHEINQNGNSVFEPSMVWIKSRSAATLHVIQDQVRGDFVFYPNLTNAEGATGGGWVKSFDSDGFTTDVNVQINDSGQTFVAWQWKANGAGSSNTDGTVASTVSANPTAGFSIAKWTHTTASNYTVGHGLGAVPKMILVKTTDQATNWGVYHSDITVGNRLILNSTSAQVAGYWGANSWTSSTFSIGSVRDTNGSTAVAYCFAEIPGYSSIGSYEGNTNTDGPFVYTGFRPAFVLVKNIDAATVWPIQDTARSPFNLANAQVFANLSNAETTGYQIDILSNGFKARSADTGINGATMIYMAFAEHPFGGDGVAPATAR
jgi:hypothetical protein